MGPAVELHLLPGITDNIGCQLLRILQHKAAVLESLVAVFSDLFFQLKHLFGALLTIIQKVYSVAEVEVHKAHKSGSLQPPLKFLHDLLLHLLELLGTVVFAGILLVAGEVGDVLIQLNGFGGYHQAATTHEIHTVVSVALVWLLHQQVEHVDAQCQRLKAEFELLCDPL